VTADAATGILFSPLNYENLAHAIARAVRLHADAGAWASIQKRGMAADFSWARSGKTYAELYARLKEQA
jgi:starch synthase